MSLLCPLAGRFWELLVGLGSKWGRTFTLRVCVEGLWFAARSWGEVRALLAAAARWTSSSCRWICCWIKISSPSRPCWVRQRDVRERKEEENNNKNPWTTTGHWVDPCHVDQWLHPTVGNPARAAGTGVVQVEESKFSQDLFERIKKNLSLSESCHHHQWIKQSLSRFKTNFARLRAEKATNTTISAFQQAAATVTSAPYAP